MKLVNSWFKKTIKPLYYILYIKHGEWELTVAKITYKFFVSKIKFIIVWEYGIFLLSHLKHSKKNYYHTRQVVQKRFLYHKTKPQQKNIKWKIIFCSPSQHMTPNDVFNPPYHTLQIVLKTKSTQYGCTI